MNILDVLSVYYVFVFIIVGVIGTLIITLSDDVFDLDSILSERDDFIRCIFMYQFAVYELLKDEINKAGIIILEVLTTLSVWFLNVFVFCIAVFCLMIKMICLLFWMIFKKRDESEGSEKE